MYPVIIIDAIVLKIREGQVANRPVYVAMGQPRRCPRRFGLVGRPDWRGRCKAMDQYAHRAEESRHHGRMHRVLRRVLGSRLQGVKYDLLEWQDEPSPTSIVDTVPKAVILEFDETSVLLRWDLRPPSEQLLFLSSEGVTPGPLVRRVDVSQRWGAFLGARLVAASWAQQETGDGLQPWAVTLAFADAGELVLALGEVVDGSLSYIPDSLIVTASRDAALSYQPPAALTPAWTAGP